MAEETKKVMSNLEKVDALLIPSMMNLNVSDAFDVIGSLCHEMRENEILCRRLVARLMFLRTRPAKPEESKTTVLFADTLGHFIVFLKKFSTKKLLQRLALNRIIVKGIRALHSEIDGLFEALGLASAPEMSAWKDNWQQDLVNQLSLLEQLTASPHVATELTGGSLEEALTELKYEIDGRMNATALAELMTRTLASVEHRAGLPPRQSSPSWYIRRDDIELVGDVLDFGSFGEVHRAKWGADKTDVVVKSLYMDSADAQESFLGETEIWHRLTHPHIIKMHGGCHVGKPLFFVADFAPGGNFADFFERSEENKRQLWRLFHQAAQGLLHLHTRTPTIIHGDIKCNNFLVGSDGKAKLCDFGYSHIRTLSIGKSIKEQPSTVRWKAPECLLEQGVAANPSPASDTYAFGMSIIEAVTGELPWGMRDDNDIINQVASGEGYSRPEKKFTDKEWKLVQQMTAFEKADRMRLDAAIKVLAELAEEELRKDIVVCPTCGRPNSFNSKFCSECGTKLTDKSQKATV